MYIRYTNVVYINQMLLFTFLWLKIITKTNLIILRHLHVKRKNYFYKLRIFF